MSATSTPYISGMKKPLNMIEGPVYPDIKKAPPRFKWSRKHWNVDEGATMRDTEPYNQFYENAVLVQSRDYNQSVYGKSSHKDIVNAEFRPPLISPYEDLGPLTRIPATIYSIIPHINPSTAGHDGGTSGYESKNQRPSDIEGNLTDRIGSKEWRPTFYAPMELPVDNSVLPDLEVKIPHISINAGWNIPYRSQQYTEYELGEAKYESPIHTGTSTHITFDGPTGMENYETTRNLPQYSTSSGTNTNVQVDSEQKTPVLNRNLPKFSATSGSNTQVTIDSEATPVELDYVNPQVPVSAGYNIPVSINSETKVDELLTKLGSSEITVLNPGMEEGGYNDYQSRGIGNNYVRNNKPAYSYQVPSQTQFKIQNEKSHKPHFREKLQPRKSYGNISQSGSSIPQFGINNPNYSLKNPNKQKINYHF